MQRADAILCRFGYCSRREAPTWLRAGRLSFRGEAVTSPSRRLDPAEVLVDGCPVPFPDGLYVALHKPVGCTCSHAREGDAPSVYSLLPPQWLRRSPTVQSVGRLDKETSGLLLLSDDGAFVHALTSPKRHIEKVYRFRCAAPVPAEAVQLFSDGHFMLHGESSPCLPAHLQIDAADACTGQLSLCEGRYHQVRRMLAAVGAPVLELSRVSVGPLSLASLCLPAGEWTAIDPVLFSYAQ